MSCEECKEQIFELIERESIDPEGVRATLAQCPDCRKRFDEVKATLLLARELPLEEPPAELDARILAAAERHIAGMPLPEDGGAVIPLRRRLLQPPPWAMAAVALLAVGIGVWSIPRSVEYEARVEELDPKTETAPASGSVNAPAVAPAVDEEVLGEQGAPKVTAQESEAPVAGTARRKERAPSKQRKAIAAKRKAGRADSDDSFGAEAEPAPVVQASPPSTPARRRRATESAAGAAAADLAAADAAMEDATDETATRRAACEAMISRLESRLESRRAFDPSPKDELAFGRCYALLGQAKKARVWLERAAEHPETKEQAREALEGLPRR